MRRFIPHLLLISCTMLSLVNNDTISELLTKRLKAYHMENPSTTLFLHMDKSVYSQNENLWFKAYVLTGTVIDNAVLYVRLTNERKELMLCEQFPVYDVRAHGELVLPDTLKDGTYYLYAYTDRMINFNEEDVFVQKIRVQRDAAQELEATASVSDSSSIRRGQRVQVLLKIKEGINLLKNVKGRYELSDGKNIIRTGKITTDLFGEATVDFVYPQLPDDHTLRVKAIFEHNRDYVDLNLNLRHEGVPIRLNVYPEGGHLIPKFSGRVIVEALDVNGNPVNTRLALIEGERKMKEILTDSYGLASFDLKPKPGERYFIRHLKDKNVKEVALNVDSVSYGLSIIRKGSSLMACIKNSNEDGNILLGFRTQEEVLLTKSILVPKGDSVLLPFTFKGIPKNVINVFIIDETKRVKAERLLLRPGNDSFRVTVSTDRLNYGSRKKINASVLVSNSAGQPASANLSVAVVEKSRILPEDYRTMLNTYYYRCLNGNNCNHFITENIEQDIDRLLITKVWLRGTNPEVLNYVPKGKLVLLENTGGISGKVYPVKPEKFKLRQLVFTSKERAVQVDINNEGRFSILPQELITDRGIEWRIPYDKNSETFYTLKINNYATQFDNRVRSGSALFMPAKFAGLSYNKPVPIKPSGNGRLLREVVVKAKGPYKNADSGFPRCSGYICINSILNCPLHPNERGIPEEGQAYMAYPIDNFIFYRCVTSSAFVQRPKVFPAIDFTKEQLPEPVFETTLYWNPNIDTDPEGKANFSFFSNNLDGDFLIIVQGIESSKGIPLYGKGGFKVEQKP